MKIHEYQAKAILAKFGVPVPRGEVVFKKDDARAVARAAGNARRRREGADSRGWPRQRRRRESWRNRRTKPRRSPSSILGMKLVTPQTGAEGRIVRRLLIEEGLDIKRELYLSILVDRAVGAPGFHGQRRGRHGNRGSRERASRSDSARDDSSRRRACSPTTRASSRSAWDFRAELVNAAVPFFQSLYRAFHGNGRVAARNQSLRRHRRRPAGRARRQNEFRRQRALSPSRIQGAARSRRRNAARSRSLEIQAQLHQARRHGRAAWSTARAWPWPRWTSSS